MITGILVLIFFFILLILLTPTPSREENRKKGDTPWCIKIEMDGKRYNRGKSERWF